METLVPHDRGTNPIVMAVFPWENGPYHAISNRIRTVSESSETVFRWPIVSNLT